MGNFKIENIEVVKEDIITDPEVYYNRAFVLFDTKHFDDALVDIEKAIKYGKGNCPKYIIFKAKILFEAGNLERCFQFITSNLNMLINSGKLSATEDNSIVVLVADCMCELCNDENIGEYISQDFNDAFVESLICVFRKRNTAKGNRLAELLSGKKTNRREPRETSIHGGNNSSKAVVIDKNIGVSISLPMHLLKKALKQTIYVAASAQSIDLRSICFYANQRELFIMALDGHRIAQSRVSLNECIMEKVACISAESAEILFDELPNSTNDNVTCIFSIQGAMFVSSTRIIASNLTLDGFFYDGISAVNNIKTMLASGDKDILIQVSRYEMLEILGRFCKVMVERMPCIIDIKDRTMVFSIKTRAGLINKSVNVTKGGGALRIGVNPRYLLEAVRVVDNNNVEIHFSNAPQTINIIDNSGGYRCMVLPINLTQYEN